ncbi:tRNA cyclic N6-threonylcarbamoyladenosine(37) synthase TcdA [Helicobacter enhydrae]|uniref:tRNA cyclic N6-threonylcarbamoyladenosine(37) synthase TcdA n=1 Tax=Helicobacter enhydrae TaxID=222136 RepID=A0A1B1U3P3_9HELI|nr:tRNA threonylcarbamoyladenosine dehydratase [Helicobacter enhydrae]ANV97380.1 tRNA cyclic N6-threonylcarbamoyladenosine(37) synthase TcdA [Helicobacter enhydrae]
MNIDRYTRSRIIFGEHFETMQKTKVLIFGVGGVGGYAIDALYRSGVTQLTIVDKDRFDVTNQNRQIGSESVGEIKVEVLAKLYPGITPIHMQVDAESLQTLDFDSYDYIVDAIDDIPAKILLAQKAQGRRFGTYISSTGSAKKLNPLLIQVSSIWKSHGDKFARKLRDNLKKQRFRGNFKVIFSDEIPNCKPLGSCNVVTGSFGLQIASEILRDIKAQQGE